MDATPIAAFLLGLAGSAHCVAMCGGLVSALDRVAPGQGKRRIGAHFLYATGRVSSYTLFGALAGTLGFVVAEAAGPELLPRFQMATRWGVGLLLIAFGIAMAGFRPFRRIERMGLSMWRKLQPLSRHLVGLPGPMRTIGLGALWGFIPCGMVYGAAAVAAVTGSALQGALFMAAFGLGTVPAVVSTGAFASELWSRIGRQNLQRGAALAVSLCGVWTLVGPGLMKALAHGHH